MLNTQSDRLDYRELLAAPLGYQVDFAVGTTYSLDLQTLTAVCAILGLDVDVDSIIAESPPHMLEAIRRAGSKLLVFCQSGQITAPEKLNKLLPLLEDCVVEINLKNGKSFHPKIWFVRYKAKNKPDRFRLIVLSRNLTFDRSWDMALSLDSVSEAEQALEKSESTGENMRAFLVWLYKRVRGYNRQLAEKRKWLRSMAEVIANIEWCHAGKIFTKFDFIPYGIGVPSTDNLFKRYNKMLVISPFLSKGIIDEFARNRLMDSDCTLITRKSELPKLNTDLLSTFSTYTLRDEVIDGEDALSESDNVSSQDIHAKLYLRTLRSQSELYIGSANATNSAFYGGNVECLVALKGYQRYCNVDKLKADLGLLGDERTCAFAKVEPFDYPQGSDDLIHSRIEQAIRQFAALKKRATVKGVGPYQVFVEITPFTSNVALTLSPLMQPHRQPICDTMLFPDLQLQNVSEWYEVTAECEGLSLCRVVKIRTDGIPDERSAAIFSSLITTQGTFLAYVAFLLSDDHLSAYLENFAKGLGSFQPEFKQFDTPVLYERMLQVAAHNPERLYEIREVMALLSEEIIPQEFVALFEQFAKVVKK